MAIYERYQTYVDRIKALCELFLEFAHYLIITGAIWFAADRIPDNWFLWALKWITFSSLIGVWVTATFRDYGPRHPVALAINLLAALSFSYFAFDLLREVIPKLATATGH
jgi:hypothetical protein